MSGLANSLTAHAEDPGRSAGPLRDSAAHVGFLLREAHRLEAS
jgi:hypothetical protein